MADVDRVIELVQAAFPDVIWSQLQVSTRLTTTDSGSFTDLVKRQARCKSSLRPEGAHS